MLDPSTVTPDQSAPTSVLGATTGSDPSQAPVQANTNQSQLGAPDGSNDLQESQAAQPTSRLQAIIQAVAKVGSTALSGIPDRGRPSFVTGLGEGARAEQNAVAQQQAIKFKTFDDQVRMAQLHNQDLKMQQDTEAQRDAHTKADLENRSLANNLGIKYDTIASDGKTVMDHLTSQTAATGSASVPPGTHLSGDGESINIPTNDQATQDGQKQMYSMLAPALGLSPLPPGAQFVPPKNMNMLTNKIHGYNIDGSAPKHDDLLTMIGTAQANRDQLAKNGASPQQLQAVDNMIGIYKANLDSLDKHAADVQAKNKQAQLDVENSPDNQAAAARGAGMKAKAELPSKIALQDNSAANKAQAAAGQLGYAYDPKNDQTVAVTADEAKAQGLTTFRKVNQTQISGDTHNASVLNDVSSKTNAVIQSASALDQNGKQRDIISWALGDNGIKIGFGDHLALPMDALVNNSLNSRNMGQASDQTKNYIIGILSLREAAMGMNRVLTGSARASESQIKALQATLPGYDANSGVALQRLRSFAQNVDQLRKPIPVIPGVPRTPITFGQ
ncbi:MAG TPA: hypothetical protein VHV10_13745 [Ktedonobacteraceae bacterium]|jgi:hypothetical protein|nr:hypothetical protein [Ktedonobacteraceae bacterium]